MCQKAFGSLHGITRGRTIGVAGRVANSITSPQDMRGRHNNRPKRIPEVVRHQIKDHIKSFPSKQSHYSRKDTARKYLSAELHDCSENAQSLLGKV